MDQNALLASSVFVECVDVADAEFVMDAKEILGFHEGIEHVNRMALDMELVELGN